MSDTAEFARHIRSVSQTRQITNAMYLAASSKMHKALDVYEKNKSFLKEMRPVIKSIIESKMYHESPIFLSSDPNKTAYIVIGSDQGLAGSYNSDVISLAVKQINANEHVAKIFCVGDVIEEYFSNNGYDISLELDQQMHTASIHGARFVARTIFDELATGEFDEVYVVFTEIINTFHHRTVSKRLIPFKIEDFSDCDGAFSSNTEMLPNVDSFIKNAISLYVIGSIFSSIAQSYAAEQCIRMQSMDTATRNADEMTAILKKELSRSRQETITQEITEIVSGYMN